MLVWLDGRTNVRAAAAGELRARADGAVHAGRRRLRGDRRLRRRARVHRLEPDPRQPQHARRRATSSSTTPAQHDTTAKEFTFPIYRRRPARSFPRGPPATACRTASTSSTPSRGTRTPGRGWRASSTPTSSTKSMRPTKALIDGARAALLRARTTRSSRWCGCCCSRRSSRIRRTTTSATRGRSSSSCGR